MDIRLTWMDGIGGSESWVDNQWPLWPGHIDRMQNRGNNYTHKRPSCCSGQKYEVCLVELITPRNSSITTAPTGHVSYLPDIIEEDIFSFPSNLPLNRCTLLNACSYPSQRVLIVAERIVPRCVTTFPFDFFFSFGSQPKYRCLCCLMFLYAVFKEHIYLYICSIF